MREFVDKHVTPDAREKEQSGERPSVELVQLCGSTGVNALRLGPGKHLQGRKLPAGLKWDEVDYFHEMIVNQELARAGERGFGDGFQGGMVIGLPPGKPPRASRMFRSYPFSHQLWQRRIEEESRRRCPRGEEVHLPRYLRSFRRFRCCRATMCCQQD